MSLNNLNFRDYLGKQLLFFDGGMGTMLYEAGLKPGELPDIWNVAHPDVVRDMHSEYLRAGCNILTTNTFGCTAAKLEGSGYGVKSIASKSVMLAREAIETVRAQTSNANGKPYFVAYDVGPTGKLLKPLGDLGFETAVEYFKESITAGANADLVLVETMSDTYELKAAVIAAKECCDLPIVATVTLDQKGRLLTGGNIASVVALLEGLSVDALGLNCGLGPVQMLEFLDELSSLSSIPIVLTPNAGLPREQNGQTIYDISPDDFAELMSKAPNLGAHILGGCCGTTPKHMEALTKACEGIRVPPVVRKSRTAASGAVRAITFGDGTRIIGERINPTGKPLLKQALFNKDYGYVIREGIQQLERGADALDVNAGLPGINEEETLVEIIRELQAAVDIPLSLDTSDKGALEQAMRAYNGKPIVNSVNGKEESMNAVFPLVKKYGGVVIALTLDENGIPDTIDGRVQIARRIVERAASFGIDQREILVDALTMGISTEPLNARLTLETLRRISEELQVNTVLGVSNVSFGLPGRDKLNAAFLTMAMGYGLSAAIINPSSDEMLGAYHSAKALNGNDPGCEAYIASFSGHEQARGNIEKNKKDDLNLEQAVIKGLREEAASLAREALKTMKPLDIISSSLVPALDTVGSEYEKGAIYLPGLLMSAEAAKSAFEVIQKELSASGAKKNGLIVLATVEGDIHDIGKNIAKALLSNYQYEVIDLGKDVNPEAILEAARKHDAKLVGLSALMTTTVASMEKTVALIKRELPECRVMVGGAVLTEDYAINMGADKYVKDAMAGVRYAQDVFQNY